MVRTTTGTIFTPGWLLKPILAAVNWLLWFLGQCWKWFVWILQKIGELILAILALCWEYKIQILIGRYTTFSWQKHRPHDIRSSTFSLSFQFHTASCSSRFFILFILLKLSLSLWVFISYIWCGNDAIFSIISWGFGCGNIKFSRVGIRSAAYFFTYGFFSRSIFPFIWAGRGSLLERFL